uniref:Probable pectate lyase F n=1 Tax=Meloidogyne incognita TaxID=6306 RepID=A0A914LQX2_MELIC
MFKNNLIFLFFSILYSCEADFWPQARKNITLKAPKKVGGKFDCKYDRYIPDPQIFGDGSQRERQKHLKAPKKVGGKFDCKYDRYIPDPQIFGDGSQRERQKHVFILKNGATLSNCIIGAAPGTQGSADGIICIGDCNINNVWFEDVGEDAITFYGTSGDPVYNVKGGGARHAADKVFQFDGKGTANIEDYYVEDYVRLFRCCGNCKTEYERRVNIRNLTAIDGMPGQFIVGINEGDVAHLHDIKIDTEGVHPCKLFKPKAGGEPKSLGTGINEYCDYEEAEINYIPARSTQKKKQK